MNLVKKDSLWCKWLLKEIILCLCGGRLATNSFVVILAIGG
jgi:hypothetical protein